MTAITVSDLTSGTVTGTGVFDQLMVSVKAHLEEEYNKSRIRGSEYATVYLGAIQSVMDRSLDFLLQQQRVDLEAQLLAEQIITQQKTQLQIDAQTGLLNQQTANAVVENTVLVAQECKLRAEFDLLVEQKLKSIAETALLAQKKVTEQAQTSGTGIGADSVLGKQIALYSAQAAGFARDAEQKAAKLLIDTFNVRMTTDPDGTLFDETNKLSDANIGAVITKLKEGINA